MLSWTWKDTLTFKNTDVSFEIGFTSNGQHFDKLIVQKVDDARYVGYCNGANCTLVYDSGVWSNASFKKLTFDTLPNGQLLSILSLQATADKKVSKVEINGITLLDVSSDTVTPSVLAKGYIAHDAAGNRIVGKLTQSATDYSALFEFGDAAGAGCVITSPDRLELRVYSPRSVFGFGDAGFESLLDNMRTSLTDVSTMLETYAQQIMGIYATKFNDVFTGAEKALFFDEKHPCDIPEFLSSDATTWAGLLSALLRSYSSQSWVNYQSRLFLDPNDCIKWYGTQGSTGSFSNGDRGRFLYTWFPGVADGDPVMTGYNLQEPTGAMPTWDGGYKVYAGTTSKSMCGCFNVIPAYGITSQFFIMFIAGFDGIVMRSDAAHTVPEAFLQQFNQNWTYGNIVAPAGWSLTTITSAGAAATESVQVEALQQIVASMGGLPDGVLPFDTMDEYTKSYFAEILTQQYKKLNDKTFTLEFNLYAKE